MSVQTLQEPLTPTVNRAWKVDVNVSTTEVPEWLPVRGRRSTQPTIENTTQDATDSDSDGWGADAVTLRKWKLIMELLRNVKRSTKAYDPGQEALRRAANQSELESVHIRWWDKTSPEAEAYEGYALVQWEPGGGDPTGLQTATATLLGQGARIEITNPIAELTT